MSRLVTYNVTNDGGEGPPQSQEGEQIMTEDSYIDSVWCGEGWYKIGWSDGGQAWTANEENSEPVAWFASPLELDEVYTGAVYEQTETHLPWVEYWGDGETPVEPED